MAGSGEYLRKLTGVMAVPRESSFQENLDIVLGVLFLIIAFFAGYRCVQSWLGSTGGRKVISVFNTLLFLASLTRAIWFLIPNYCLEPSYEPLALKIKDYHNSGEMISEALLSIGTFSLYGIFILIACYWYTMLWKLDADKSSTGNDPITFMTPAARDSSKAVGSLELFFPLMFSMILVESINVIFFYLGWFTTEEMVAYDGVTFAAVAGAVLVTVVYLSRRINRVLRNMEIINQSSSQAQIRRIEAIVFLAQLFFFTRIVIELAMYFWMMDFPHVFVGQGGIADSRWWTAYIIAKHSFEVFVLGFELFISSAIRSYDNRRLPANTLNHRYEGVPTSSVEMPQQPQDLSSVGSRWINGDSGAIFVTSSGMPVGSLRGGSGRGVMGMNTYGSTFSYSSVPSAYESGHHSHYLHGNGGSYGSSYGNSYGSYSSRPQLPTIAEHAGYGLYSSGTDREGAHAHGGAAGSYGSSSDDGSRGSRSGSEHSNSFKSRYNPQDTSKGTTAVKPAPSTEDIDSNAANTTESFLNKSHSHEHHGKSHEHSHNTGNSKHKSKGSHNHNKNRSKQTSAPQDL